MCGMFKPGSVPPPDVRRLRDLMRCRRKRADMQTGGKNRALNCLTVSDLKHDDVFSDVFGKSSPSILTCILEHPGEKPDAAPFIDKHGKHPPDELRAAADGAVSREQAAKLRKCLQHVDEIGAHRGKGCFAVPFQGPSRWLLCFKPALPLIS